MSPLTQGRGLKYPNFHVVADDFGSPLTQGRGLKFMGVIVGLILIVAPHAGAWIEIITWRHNKAFFKSPLTQGRGLKSSTPLVPSVPVGRPSRRGVD